jgi:hypothetical protein
MRAAIDKLTADGETSTFGNADRSESVMSDDPRPAHSNQPGQIEARSVPVPDRVVPPHLLPGVYANQAFQISTTHETVLDFSVAVPDRVELDENARVRDVSVAHQLVSRVIMPTPQFDSFVISYATRNPIVKQAILDAIDQDPT